ncbi:MAG: DNA topoisomerase III, partial [Tannerella sp.]|nr:DNA topoisomerase III [Tannerella sp.]
LQQVTGKEFTVTGITTKKGREAPPRLFDLTSLQVECNRKFAFSAEETLKWIQSLYEKKLTTYPRVDTTFLSDDMYPKIPQTLKGLTAYAALTAPLLAGKIPKSKKVFDNSKVTDHHAIIPTGVTARNLSDREQKIYDLVARRFIAVFYPDCEVSTTTVLGEVENVGFKATGRQILKPGWRVVFEKEAKEPAENADRAAGSEPTDEAAVILPDFVKGEHGPHQPDFAEKWTTPPKPYTEATLLRAMETAGKLVDDDELRDALKENGIGRPSTRAAIIETLFKRNYIRREKKSLFATPTGVELIGVIRDELLKSAELTGQWEKKLRRIEKGAYEAAVFLDELKQLVGRIVQEVCSDTSARSVALGEAPVRPSGERKKTDAAGNPEKKTGKTVRKSSARASKSAAATPPACPHCGGAILRGHTAYGCAGYKNGCTFRLPYETYGKDRTDSELCRMIKEVSHE